MNIHSAVASLVHTLYDQGLRRVVISPGSRNAPLINAFEQCQGIECYSIIDERSAGFVALGMALQSRQCTALLCTSGTALLNYYPAVAEAFYAEIPLLIISADRPSSLIDNWDGQCIRQGGVLESHVRGSFNCSENYKDLNAFSEIALDAYRIATSSTSGPVHINVPLTEPLYDIDNVQIHKIEKEEIDTQTSETDWNLIKEAINNSERILWFNGAQDSLDQTYQIAPNVVVLSDIIANTNWTDSIRNWDAALTVFDVKELKPDVLITTGKYTVSKAFKQFIRKNPPKIHFHLSDSEDIGDPFFTRPIHLPFPDSSDNLFENFSASENYLELWQGLQLRVVDKIEKLDWSDFNEFGVLARINDFYGAGSFHWGNSMPVRYASFLGRDHNSIHHSNRGTSGIDGSMSTAVGYAILSSQPEVLILGDLSFFYDANALWNNYVPTNLHIIVINNAGGGIFGILDGPSEIAGHEKFQLTTHQRSAESLAKEHGLKYFCTDNYLSLDEALGEISNYEGSILLEVMTERINNEKFYKSFKADTHE